MPPVRRTCSLRAAGPHVITWLLAAGLISAVIGVHQLAAGSSDAGTFVREFLRAGDPKGPSQVGAMYGLFVSAVPIFSLSLVLAQRYVRYGLTAAAAACFVCAALMTAVIWWQSRLLLSADPTFPVPNAKFPLFMSQLFISIPGSLFGSAVGPRPTWA